MAGENLKLEEIYLFFPEAPELTSEDMAKVVAILVKNDYVVAIRNGVQGLIDDNLIKQQLSKLAVPSARRIIDYFHTRDFGMETFIWKTTNGLCFTKFKKRTPQDIPADRILVYLRLRHDVSKVTAGDPYPVDYKLAMPTITQVEKLARQAIE